MNFKNGITIAILLTCMSAPTIVLSHDYKAGSIQINHPWSRITPVSAPVAGGYLTLTNTGESADKLVGATSPAAAKLELHTSTTTDGIARMRPLLEGLAIAPGETIQLAPGGTHIMFLNPADQFKDGDRIDAVLEFEKAGKIHVQFAVQGMGAKSASSGGHEDHGQSKN